MIGAGIIGLSCAVRVKEVLGAACAVTIIADKFGVDTTSDIAAGSFRPANFPQVSGYAGKRIAVGKYVMPMECWFLSEGVGLNVRLQPTFFLNCMTCGTAGLQRD